jgi:hypothetical protein
LCGASQVVSLSLYSGRLSTHYPCETRPGRPPCALPRFPCDLLFSLSGLLRLAKNMAKNMKAFPIPQKQSCPSHSGVLPLRLVPCVYVIFPFGREGSVIGGHIVPTHEMAKQLLLSQDVLWTRQPPVVCFIWLSGWRLAISDGHVSLLHAKYGGGERRSSFSFLFLGMEQLLLSQDVLWTRQYPVICFVCLSGLLRRLHGSLLHARRR